MRRDKKLRREGGMRDDVNKKQGQGEEKDPGEMSTTDKKKKEVGKESKCQGESVYLDFTHGKGM